MLPESLWITGPARSGKTSRLVRQLKRWTQSESVTAHQLPVTRSEIQQTERGIATRPGSILVFAANAENRFELANQIASVTVGHYSIDSTTPLGFFQDEVKLFWPLLIQQLNLSRWAHSGVPFPLRLRPETEQELATRLWRQELDSGLLRIEGVSTERIVRRALDLLQLAAFSGTPIQRIPALLGQGFAGQEPPPAVWDCIGALLIRWRNWCLERGLLTYGILTELYWQHLLPDAVYQQHLAHRYQVVLADDVDNYPAIASDLFNLLLDQGGVGIFTSNPDGAIRLGLGADPKYLSELSRRCVVETLNQPLIPCLGAVIDLPIGEFLQAPTLSLPESIQSIQTTSRGQLLRQTAEVIIQAVQSGQVEPQDIAVIGPGLDAIARYTLIEILSRQGILVESLNDQRPLATSPMIRALLTLLALVYSGLGQWVNRDHVAEMLVILSFSRGYEATLAESKTIDRVRIDPVRAGLLADYCFKPHPEYPHLLPATAFPHWNRLGYQATTAYEEILQWLSEQRLQQEQRLIPSPISVLDRAIQRFLWPSNLSYDQLAALRELLETAQHYWEVDARLSQSGYNSNQPEVLSRVPLISSPHGTVGRLIQLLRSGTVTANPFPAQTTSQRHQAVTLATTFQYRSSRQSHRWHFWLDAGSSLWRGGGAVVLWGAPFFLKSWSGQAWTLDEAIYNDQEQLQRLLLDLLSRVETRVYLCHSDLSVNGQEQTGPLLPLVDASAILTLV